VDLVAGLTEQAGLILGHAVLPRYRPGQVSGVDDQNPHLDPPFPAESK
jgi:hypothetical protein